MDLKQEGGEEGDTGKTEDGFQARREGRREGKEKGEGEMGWILSWREGEGKKGGRDGN